MAELEWGPLAGWCQISASADRPSYKATEAIFITVIVKNASDRPAPYPPFPFAAGRDYEVTSADGTPVELTAHGRHMLDVAQVRSEGVRQLKPGQEVVYEVHLNRDYDLTRAGRYHFQVRREIPPAQRGEAPFTAVSNVVPVEVRDER